VVGVVKSKWARQGQSLLGRKLKAWVVEQERETTKTKTAIVAARKGGQADLIVDNTKLAGKQLCIIVIVVLRGYKQLEGP
jgi:hypothetical protein